MLTSYAEDPTLLSGTLRSTLDVVGEHQDAEIVSSFGHKRTWLIDSPAVRSTAPSALDLRRVQNCIQQPRFSRLPRRRQFFGRVC
jgi:hypothetical protein